MGTSKATCRIGSQPRRSRAVKVGDARAAHWRFPRGRNAGTILVMFAASVTMRGAPPTRTRRLSRPAASGLLRFLLTPIFTFCLLGTCLSCGPLAHNGAPAAPVGVEQLQAAEPAFLQAAPVSGRDGAGAPIKAPARTCAGCAGHIAPMPAEVQVARTAARQSLSWRSESALAPPPADPHRLDRPPRA